MYSVPFQWESEPSDNDRNGKNYNIFSNKKKRKSSKRHRHNSTLKHLFELKVVEKTAFDTSRNN